MQRWTCGPGLTSWARPAGDGFVDLYGALQPLVDSAAGARRPQPGPESGAAAAEPGAAELGPGTLKMAIVGLPNVVRALTGAPAWPDMVATGARLRAGARAQGKSTLGNRLLGRGRWLTGPEPGLTRDSVAATFEWEGRPVELVDTAGLVRTMRLQRDEAGRAPLPRSPHAWLWPLPAC